MTVLFRAHLGSAFGNSDAVAPPQVPHELATPPPARVLAHCGEVLEPDGEPAVRFATNTSGRDWAAPEARLESRPATRPDLLGAEACLWTDHYTHPFQCGAFAGRLPAGAGLWTRDTDGACAGRIRQTGLRWMQTVSRRLSYIETVYPETAVAEWFADILHENCLHCSILQKFHQDIWTERNIDFP